MSMTQAQQDRIALDIMAQAHRAISTELPLRRVELAFLPMFDVYWGLRNDGDEVVWSTHKAAILDRDEDPDLYSADVLYIDFEDDTYFLVKGDDGTGVTEYQLFLQAMRVEVPE